jgi:hypothetical protein
MKRNVYTWPFIFRHQKYNPFYELLTVPNSTHMHAYPNAFIDTTTLEIEIHKCELKQLSS